MWAILVTLSGPEQDPASLWVVATAEVCPPTSHLCRFSGRTQGGAAVCHQRFTESLSRPVEQVALTHVLQVRHNSLRGRGGCPKATKGWQSRASEASLLWPPCGIDPTQRCAVALPAPRRS